MVEGFDYATAALSVVLELFQVGASRTPRCASSMILEATSRVFGSSANLSANVSHTFSSASDISRIISGSNDWLARNGRIGIIAPQTFQVGAQSGLSVNERPWITLFVDVLNIGCSEAFARPKFQTA